MQILIVDLVSVSDVCNG